MGIFIIAALVAVIALAGAKRVEVNKAIVQGEETVGLGTPTNVSVGNFFCKNNWPWATISWNGVSGANAYRIKFWKTSGEFLHSEIAESTSHTTEMYKEFDTDISVQALVREGQGEETRIIHDGDDSTKFRLTNVGMQIKCGTEDKESKSDDEEESEESSPEPTKAPKVASPTPQSTIEANEEIENERASDVENRIARLERENEGLQAKQNVLEALIADLLSILKNIFQF